MALYDFYDRKIPDYYHSMYLDGYTPEQILHAKRRQMRQNILERREQAEITNLKISTEVKIKK